MSAATTVTVVGGGFAGLETVFGLRAKLGERARLTLVSDGDDFLFKPNTIYIPFRADPTSLLIPLATPAARRDIRLVRARVDAVDRDTGTVHAGGEAIRSDYTVLATGAGMRPEEIPGLVEHAETIWTPAEMAALGDLCVMEELDTATFAQVPLVVTGDPERPVAVRPDANGAYRVGVSPLWRLGKKMLGLYLPLRFRSGLPFHEGAPWRAMEVGLRGMSAALARR